MLVSVGDYTLRVRHPQDGGYSNMWVEQSGTIAANKGTRNGLLTLNARAAIRSTVVDQNAGMAPVSGVQVGLTDAGRCANPCAIGATNESGQLLLTDVSHCSYRISVRALQGRSALLDGVVTLRLTARRWSAPYRSRLPRKGWLFAALTASGIGTRFRRTRTT